MTSDSEQAPLMIKNRLQTMNANADMDFSQLNAGIERELSAYSISVDSTCLVLVERLPRMYLSKEGCGRTSFGTLGWNWNYVVPGSWSSI